jgi:DNA-binding transcriptional ArsR family regulator
MLIESLKGENMGLQQTLRALADPIRREILNLLKSGRMSAGDIVEHFDVTGASISRHLSVLKDADLIRDTREGKFIFYELNVSVLEETMLWIADLKGDKDNEGNV